MSSPHHSAGRQPTGAATGRGRAQSTAPKARTLDAAQIRGGYDSSAVKKSSAPSLDEVRRLVPMLTLLAHYGLVGRLKPVAGQFRSTCPIHDGSNPEQFVVNACSNTWFCFGDCDRGGGTLEFVSLKERVSIPRAAELISEWFLQTSSVPRQQRRTRMSTIAASPATASI